MNAEIKQLIEQKNQFYKQFIRSNKTLLYINQFKVLQEELCFMNEKSENDYYSKLSQKLCNKTTSCKAYWSILKTFSFIKIISTTLMLFMTKVTGRCFTKNLS